MVDHKRDALDVTIGLMFRAWFDVLGHRMGLLRAACDGAADTFLKKFSAIAAAMLERGIRNADFYEVAELRLAHRRRELGLPPIVTRPTCGESVLETARRSLDAEMAAIRREADFDAVARVRLYHQRWVRAIDRLAHGGKVIRLWVDGRPVALPRG